MSSALETRLAETLAALPAPSPLVEERALAAALEALPPVRRRRARRTLVLVAAVVALLGAGAAALAAIGTIHVQVGPQREVPAAALRLSLPAGASAIAVVAGGKLWLTSRRGTRIEALPATAAALSPHGLYVGAGVGRSLVAMSPAGRRAWSHPTPGPVEQIAWAPDGLRIAYVVRSGGDLQLRAIEGDGDHDRLVAASVRNVRPSWRSDSLALAYVGAGGRPVVYDLAHRSRRVAGGGCGAGDGVRALAFAPRGGALAFAAGATVGVDGARGCMRFEDVLTLTGLAWTGPRRFVTVERPDVVAPATVREFRLVGGELEPRGSATSAAALASVDGAGSGIVVARRRDVVLADAPGEGNGPLRVRRTLLRLPAPARMAVSLR